MTMTSKQYQRQGKPRAWPAFPRDHQSHLSRLLQSRSPWCLLGRQRERSIPAGAEKVKRVWRAEAGCGSELRGDRSEHSRTEGPGPLLGCVGSREPMREGQQKGERPDWEKSHRLQITR